MIGLVASLCVVLSLPQLWLAWLALALSALLTGTEVRLLSNLIMRVEPGTLLGPLDQQATVLRTCWPMASAHSFNAVVA